MRYLKHLVSIIAAITISSAVFANEIKMGKADWDTGYFQAEIYTVSYTHLTLPTSDLV